MNIKEISKWLKEMPQIEISNEKKPVEFLAKIIIERQLILFDDRTPYIHLKKYYQQISDDDALAIIPNLVAESDRMMLSSSQVSECYKRVRYVPQLQIAISNRYNEGRNFLNLQNGVFDIRTQKIIQSDAKYYFNYILDFNYLSHQKLSDAPTFKKFIETSLGRENLDCMLRSIAYCLSSLTKGRKAFLFIGHGKTGKSTLLNLIESAFNKKLVSHEPFHSMSSERSKAKYFGKRINISRDNSNVPMKHEDSFKSLISCEETTGRNLYENSIDFLPTLKFIFASNCDLNFAHPDDAVYDRLVVILFSKKITDDIRNPELEEKLLKEKDSIFSLAIDTLKDLIESNYDFRMSDEAEEYLNHQRMVLHSVEDFLDEKIILNPNSEISSVELNQLYKRWCQANDLVPIGRNDFYKNIRNYDSSIKYCKVGCGDKRVNGFKGIRLKKRCHYNGVGNDADSKISKSNDTAERSK